MIIQSGNTSWIECKISLLVTKKGGVPHKSNTLSDKCKVITTYTNLQDSNQLEFGLFLHIFNGQFLYHTNKTSTVEII